MPGGYVRTTAVRIRHQVSRSAAHLSRLLTKSPAELLWKSPADLCRGLRSPKIWLSYKSNLVASLMHLHNSRCFQEHLRMLLHSLRPLCLSPGGSGSIWKYFEALVRGPRVSGRIACCVRTDLHFADATTTTSIYGYLLPLSTWRSSLNFIPVYYLFVLCGS